MRMWAIRVVAGVGLVVTGYLTVQSFGAASLAGCGAGSACDRVLASPWAAWFGVPVAVVGLGLWIVILIGSFVKPLHRVLVAGALLAGGAAVWFILIQAIQLDAFCPYCLAAHLCAVVLIGLVIPDRHGFTVTGTAAASLGLAALIAGQVFFPSQGSGLIAYEADDPMIDRAPIVGDPDSEHVLLMYFDYTCPHCRKTHQFLEQAKRRYGDQLALALAPAPKDAQCNPNYKITAPQHQDACELAKLALAVWTARPARFHEMNAFLFKGDQPPSVAAARERAVELIGESALERALAAPFIDAFLKAKIEQNIRLGKRTNSGGLVPKMVTSGGVTLVGQPRTAEALFNVLESRLDLKPVKSSRQ